MKFLNKKGQATTEVVLLFPLFLIFTLFIIKIYGLLIIVQKSEIAAFYAARRWQLESHRAAKFAQTWDDNFLLKDIEDKVKGYIGFKNPSTKKFLSLRKISVKVERTNVWNIMNLTIETYPPRFPLLCAYDKRDVCKRPYGDACFRGYNFVCESGGKIVVTKNIPNRDRPISFLMTNSDVSKK